MTDDDDRDRGDRPAPSSGPDSRPRRNLSVATLPEVPNAKKSNSGAPPASSSPFAVALGETAPDFELRTEEGVDIPLSALRGGPVLLAFAPARREHGQRLAALLLQGAAQLQATSATALIVVAPTTALPECGAESIIALTDPSLEVHRSYGVLDTLFGSARLGLFLIDRAGVVRGVWSQPEPDVAVPLALRGLLLLAD